MKSYFYNLVVLFLFNLMIIVHHYNFSSSSAHEDNCNPFTGKTYNYKSLFYGFQNTNKIKIQPDLSFKYKHKIYKPRLQIRIK